MTQIEERQIGELIVRIDRTLCVGFGDCVSAAPTLFELDGEDVAIFLPAAGAIERDTVLAACRACPVDALIAIDQDGHQLAP